MQVLHRLAARSNGDLTQVSRPPLGPQGSAAIRRRDERHPSTATRKGPHLARNAALRAHGRPRRWAWADLMCHVFRPPHQLQSAPGAVRITHPLHPQFGQEIDYVVHRPHWGEERVFYRDRDGHLGSLPARWPSLVPDDPVAAVAGGRARFRVEDLIVLVALVARLRS